MSCYTEHFSSTFNVKFNVKKGYRIGLTYGRKHPRRTITKAYSILNLYSHFRPEHDESESNSRSLLPGNQT